MNKNLLTLLGCSGSLALILFNVNPAKASSIPSQNTGIKGTSEITVNTEMTQDESQSSMPEINSDETIGDLAVLNLGCDCNGCRTQVTQMIQQGRLQVPQ